MSHPDLTLCCPPQAGFPGEESVTHFRKQTIYLEVKGWPKLMLLLELLIQMRDVLVPARWDVELITYI